MKATKSTDIVTKNWKAIAECGNQQLRLVLISSSGDTSTGLVRGFPQYFCFEGTPPEMPTKKRFLRLVKQMRQKKAVIRCSQDLGTPYQKLSFSGTCRGKTLGVSFIESRYPTLTNGQREIFYQCSLEQGEELEYEGATWMVVWNSNFRKKETSLDIHSLVIVPVDAFKTVH